ncbi:hypothetical protein Fmac_016131 [Flemingia macrophylla]|uniref:Peptidase M16 N-terminal domain-containing protein n=1 Tax=Flemingia macrophylla TaxID=520843 RepID=A0ABD1MGI5_9FABA
MSMSNPSGIGDALRPFPSYPLSRNPPTTPSAQPKNTIQETLVHPNPSSKKNKPPTTPSAQPKNTIQEAPAHPNPSSKNSAAEPNYRTTPKWYADHPSSAAAAARTEPSPASSSSAFRRSSTWHDLRFPRPRPPLPSYPCFLKHGSPITALADHTRVLAAPETRVTSLLNDLLVALASKTARVGVWIDFLEHMIFNGTTKSTVRELEEEIQNVGDHLNKPTVTEEHVTKGAVGDILSLRV